MKHPQEQQEIHTEGDVRQVTFQKNTLDYINSCLNPNQSWNKRYPAKKRIDWICCADVNWSLIADHIKGMDYRDFLVTPYWKAITAHLKYKAGYRCQVCNSRAYLTTHHRDYSIHGREHAHLNELIVLCNQCHQTFHGKDKKIASFNLDKEASIIRPVFVSLIALLLIFLLITGKFTLLFGEMDKFLQKQ